MRSTLQKSPSDKHVEEKEGETGGAADTGDGTLSSLTSKRQVRRRGEDISSFSNEHDGHAVVEVNNIGDGSETATLYSDEVDDLKAISARDLALDNDDSEPENSANSFHDDGDSHPTAKNTYMNQWLSINKRIKNLLLNLLKSIACYSAKNPGRVIALTTLTSITLIIVGVFTNFHVVTRNQELFTPIGSLTEIYQDWIDNESNYAESPYFTFITVHSGGENVLSVEGVSRVFQSWNAIKAMEKYDQVCGFDKEKDCRVISVTDFWSHNSSMFMEEIATDDDEEAIRVMSNKTYPNGSIVDRNGILGNSEPFVRLHMDYYSDEAALLQSAELYKLIIAYPKSIEADEFEKDISGVLSKIRKEWEADGNEWRLEYILNSSIENEMKRTIDKDIPLLVLAFIMMFVLCALYFAKRDPVQSQSIIGIGAVLSIVLSLMAVFGFLFSVGVPYTAMTQLIPFILAGIGLDDAFIITGAFSRTDPNMEMVNRVSETMDQIGISIFLSTTSTFLAFMLGSTTKIPAVRWFCYYAALCVMIDFVFQISFFISFLVYDQRRIDAKRCDILCCLKLTNQEQSPELYLTQVPEERLSMTGRLMAGYLNILLQPVTKVMVLIIFAAIFILGLLSAMQMTQYFDFTMLVSRDSFVNDYFQAVDSYANKNYSFYSANIHFRDIDLSLKENRRQMQSYVDDVVKKCKYIANPPTYFWVNDFETFIASNYSETNIQDLEFNDQIQIFLSTPPYNAIYPFNFAWDEASNITASKTRFDFSHLCRVDTLNQIEALAELREITRNSPLNKDKDEPSVFTEAPDFYYIWEFSSIVIQELLYTSGFALISVLILSLIFMPHPSGALFVTISVSMVFVELVGLLRVGGVHINSVTSVILVMAIGLSVDFVMHIVLAYFEAKSSTREGKVYIAMMDMGTSISVAGCSTLLGTMLLAFGSSEICYIFYLTFVGVVALGLGHGLILLPVVLSIIGPIPPTKGETSFTSSASL